MKILRLSAENVKRLSVVELALDEKQNLVIVAGRNGQGKTSVLDSIMYALGGGNVLPSKPVRRGQDKAMVELDLGELVVKRTFTKEGGGNLTVKKKDGTRLASPQQILDDLYGKLAFDPLEFAQMKAPQRTETLRTLLGLDFTVEEAEIKRLYEKRTILNRQVKSLEAQVSALPLHANVPKDEISADTVFAELRAATAKNQEHALQRNKLLTIESSLSLAKSSVADAEALCARLEKQLLESKEVLAGRNQDVEVASKAVEAERARVATLQDIDLTPFDAKAREVEATNRKIRDNARRAELSASLRSQSKEADDLSKSIEAIESKKKDSLANAAFPVPGLGLSEEGVTFGGIPFDQASTAEQLRCSVAMGLALNKKLPVLLVRRGNDLDDQSLALLADMAQKADAQVWLERVSTDGDVSVIIEDGHVADAEPSVPSAPSVPSPEPAKLL